MSNCPSIVHSQVQGGRHQTFRSVVTILILLALIGASLATLGCTIVNAQPNNTLIPASLAVDNYWNFTVQGTRGTNYGCIVPEGNPPFPEMRITAGQPTQVAFSANEPINFWMLDMAQYKFWNGTVYGEFGANGCRMALSVPSLFTEVESRGYSAVVQVNSTDTYFFTFDNENQDSVSVNVAVVETSGATNTASQTIVSSTPNQLSITIHGYQIPFSTLLGGLTSLLGGSGIVGWFFKTRKRRFVSAYLAKIDSTYNVYALNREECKSRLKQMKNDILQMFKKGRIDENHFEMLDTKITDYLRDLVSTSDEHAVAPKVSISPPSTSHQDKSGFCANCGAHLSNEDKICHNCGSKRE